MKLHTLYFSQRTLLAMLFLRGHVAIGSEHTADAAIAKAPITFSTRFAGGDFDLSSSSFVIGDFNRDGRLDVAALSSPDITEIATEPATVFINTELSIEGRETAAYVVGLGADEILTADFNHDGNLDLAVANAGANTVSILLGNGDGTFRPANDLVIAGILRRLRPPISRATALPT